jgi:hypothetical protein
LRNPKEFWAGLIYLFFGAGALLIARDYRMGSASKMGPAYFPAILSGLLVAIGAISIVRSFIKEGSPIGGVTIRGALLVTGATVLFGFLARRAGLAIALPLLVIVSATASIRFKWPITLAMAAGLTVACILIFLKGLGIPLPMLGSWFGG